MPQMDSSSVYELNQDEIMGMRTLVHLITVKVGQYNLSIKEFTFNTDEYTDGIRFY